MPKIDFRGRRLPVLTRFWLSVNRDGPILVKELGPCWEWEGRVSKSHGYGSITDKGKVYRVHRYSYIINVCKVPDKILVCHKCDNRKCVRPDHLFLGTAKINYDDMVSKGRVRYKPRIIIDIKKRYGYFKIIGPFGKANDYKCLCKCGTSKIVAAKSLASGHTQSCGCYNKERLSQVHKGHQYNAGRPSSNKINRAGIRYGLLTALSVDDNNRWLCRCDCGKTTTVLSTNLSGYAKNNRGCKYCARSRR